MRDEYDFEPVKGLPEKLPAGEILLWQGAPAWKNIAVRAMHVRGMAVYFVVLLAWFVLSKLSDGKSADLIVPSVLRLAVAAVVALALMTLYAWLSARSTVYTLTSKRVVIRSGVALPKVFNLPFAKIQSADLKTYHDASGDIVLALPPKDRVAYLMLWPHVRPWRFNRAEPMLRGLAQASVAAQILARALGAEGTQTASAHFEQAREDNAPSKAPRRPRAAALA